jgi:hypothetical protein
LHRHGILPAPAYRLGWSRFSCLSCIFGGADQWATLRLIAPAWFRRIATYEVQFGCTIHRSRNINEMADRGRPYEAALAQPNLVRQALSTKWSEPIRIDPKTWRLPAGAFGNSRGPS